MAAAKHYVNKRRLYIKKTKISADSFRYKNEKYLLRFSFFSIFILWFLLEVLSLGPRIPISIPIIISLLLAFFQIFIREGALRGKAILVGSNQLPEIDKLAKEVCSNLDYNDASIYVSQSPVLNAYAMGMFGNNCIVLTSSIIEALTSNELKFVIGHELAHLKCNHIFWHTLGTKNPIFQFPLLSRILPIFLLFWSRQAEYTADRGGLISSDDIDSSLFALIKINIGVELSKKVNIEELLRQISIKNLFTNSSISELFNTHPHLPKRLKQLIQFHNSDIYHNLTNRNKTKQEVK